MFTGDLSLEGEAQVYRNDLKNRFCQGGALILNQAKPAPKQLNLKSLAMQAGSKAVAARRRQKPIFQVVSVYINVRRQIKRKDAKAQRRVLG